LTRLPVLGSMPKLALDIWAGGGDMNFDKEPNGAILSCKKNNNTNNKTFFENTTWTNNRIIYWTLKLFIKDIFDTEPKFLT
jgi:hypothetical protein